MIINEDDYFAHFGTKRHSGRYPWGSGEDPHQDNQTFLGMVADLQKKGMSEVEVAEAMNMNTRELRQQKTLAKNEIKQNEISTARKLRDNGYSNIKIGEIMGKNESSVRALLAESTRDRAQVLNSTKDRLRSEVEKKGYIDIGAGVETYMGISKTKLATAAAALEEEGYKKHYVKILQQGTGQYTKTVVLGAPDSKYPKQDQIRQITEFSEDGGRTYFGIKPPMSIDSKRVGIKYAEEGGAEADGVIYVRRGVKDVEIGASQYAQVRIAVDGTHYLKGMAIYKDDMPDGVDLLFNTNKKNTGNKLDAMKEIPRDKDGNIDPDNPFGAVLKRQILKKDSEGNEHLTSVMNIVNEEGDWDEWSRTLASQTLSKQSPALAKKQLDITVQSRQKQFDEIMQLTNPAVKRKLLETFADDSDSAAVHLKAAAIPNTSWHVLLPFSSIKPTEIYAPNFENGTRVALIRYPHAGTFEIPELTVNNRAPAPKSVIGSAKDAVGIHHEVAKKLSGADFDGDAVLVIPNNNRQIKSTPSLEGLKDFDPKHDYPPYDGMHTIDGGRYRAATNKVDYGTNKDGTPRYASSNKQTEMGKITNLIADMSVRRASTDEMARAVRHSMVVIDAEKHVLDYKRSYTQNGIKALKAKYQVDPATGKAGGASTLITRAGAKDYVPEFQLRSAKEGGPIDRTTGERIFVPTGRMKINRDGTQSLKTVKVKRLAITKDAHDLSSGTVIENVYAEHSNKLKDMANKARLEMLATKSIPYSPSAKLHYSKEVSELTSALNVVNANKPRERQAQLLAASWVAMKRQANPNMDDATLKKIKAQALKEARRRMGTNPHRIEITPNQWEAIQAGAISNHMLEQILLKADLEIVKKLATPRANEVMSPAKQQRAKAMLAAGRTWNEIAGQLGVPISTVKSSVGPASE